MVTACSLTSRNTFDDVIRMYREVGTGRSQHCRLNPVLSEDADWRFWLTRQHDGYCKATSASGII